MPNNVEDRPGLPKKILRTIFGAPKDVHDTSIFHKLALIPLLAWIGLGADGLSSSAYGPEEAFRALGEHKYLAIFLGVATALTVLIISYAYSRIIEHFPHGGGGYMVATHTLGKKAGVVSGSALLVDYVLTITISIAACTDALFSFLPIEFHRFKILLGCVLIIMLIVLNIRGTKESISVLAPIFLVFIVTHIALLLSGILGNTGRIVPVSHEIYSSLGRDLSTIGGFGILLIFMRAYSLGGGTYTGIEAVSNGIQVMREPRVQTGKRTMVYMAASLAFTALGLFVSYLLVGVAPAEGKTLNAVLADSVFSSWPFSHPIALVTILSEGALLLVAAQTGFIDGPRVMGNMATDSWLPHRLSSLSERLTTHNGITVMGLSALMLLVYTKGSVSALVVMYAINVFLTFSLSEFGMSRFFIKNRHKEQKWKKHLPVHLTGLVLCLTILTVTVFEKFTEGGWVTLLITSVVIVFCYIIRSHYDTVKTEIDKFDIYFKDIPITGKMNTEPLNPKNATAIQLVNNFNGFGVHTFLSVVRNFPHMYKNFVFVSAAVIDSGSFKGAEEVHSLEASVKDYLEKYVELARKLGFPAEYRYETGTDVVAVASDLCETVSKEFSKSTVFTGQLTFRLEKFYHRILHNETAFAIQRHLQWSGITTVILPIRVDV
ncbi:MAG: APC family permease [Deltaproteobacteria bacterium]|nr:APC family permease [Deltaproteobacteria bacterium]